MAKAVCPSCGAMGVAGKECEYCVTLIPQPIKKTRRKGGEATASSPFSWYNVCPAGFEPSKRSVVGDASSSEYMVVCKEKITKDYNYITHKYEDDVDYYYAIINREGKFVKDPDQSSITLFTDNYDCLVYDGIYNILTGETIKLNIDEYKSHSIRYEYLIIRTNHSFTAFYDRHKQKLIAFDKPIPYDCNSPKKADKHTYVFKSEDKTWKVNVVGDKAVVTLKVSIKPTKASEEDSAQSAQQKSSAENEKKSSGCGCVVWSVVIIAAAFVIGMMMVGGSGSSSSDAVGNMVDTVAVEQTQAESAELKQWRKRFQTTFVGKEFVSGSYRQKMLKIRVLDNTTLQYQTGVKDNDVLDPFIKWDAPKTVRYRLTIDGSDYSKSLVWTFDGYSCDDLAYTSLNSFGVMFHLKKNRDDYDFTLGDGLELSVVKQEQATYKTRFAEKFVGKQFVCGNVGKDKFRFKVLDNSTIQYQSGVRGEYPDTDINWSSPQTASYELSIDVSKGVIDDYKVSVTMVFANYYTKELGQVLKDKSYHSTFQLKSTEDDQWMYFFSIDQDE